MRDTSKEKGQVRDFGRVKSIDGTDAILQKKNELQFDTNTRRRALNLRCDGRNKRMCLDVFGTLASVCLLDALKPSPHCISTIRRRHRNIVRECVRVETASVMLEKRCDLL